MPEQATIETREISTIRGVVKGYDGATRIVSGIASTEQLDRHGEVVVREAFQLPDDPTDVGFNASHMYVDKSGKPTVLGPMLELQMTDEGLWFRAKIDEGEFEDLWAKKLETRAIKGVSIGFISIKREMRDYEVEPGVKKKVMHHTRIELLEISLTPIQSNRGATVRQAGADTEQIRELIRAETAGAIKDLRACVMEITETQARLIATVGQLADYVRDGMNEILASLTPTELTELRVESVGGEGPKHNEQQEVVESLRRIKDELEGDKDA